MRVTYGNGGWCRIDAPDDLPGPLYVRVTATAGRLAITELYIDGRGHPLTAGDLRSLPLAAIQSWILEDTERLRSTLDVAGPDLSRLASHYGTTWGPKPKHWVADAWRAQYRDSGVRQAPMGHERVVGDVYAHPPPLRPPEDGLTDEFLSRVAAAYRAAVARREPPAKALGAQAGVSPRTIHRWVYVARQRGIMAPAGRQGRVT